jgi:transposase
MNVRYRVELSQAERDELTAMLSKGKRAARKLKRAQILLAADAGRSDEEIARAVAVSGSTVYRTKRRFVEGNLERALSEEPRPGAERKLSGKQEALLVATACANPPEGRARWTLELLADAMVKLTDHESLSGETVRRRLAENGLKPWRKDMWCIPKVDGEYVARMEDVLDLYAEAPDPDLVVVRVAAAEAESKAAPEVAVVPEAATRFAATDTTIMERHAATECATAVATTTHRHPAAVATAPATARQRHCWSSQTDRRNCQQRDHRLMQQWPFSVSDTAPNLDTNRRWGSLRRSATCFRHHRYSTLRERLNKI